MPKRRPVGFTPRKIVPRPQPKPVEEQFFGDAYTKVLAYPAKIEAMIQGFADVFNSKMAEFDNRLTKSINEFETTIVSRCVTLAIEAVRPRIDNMKPKDGAPGKDGKNANDEYIIRSVLAKIKVEDGKDADENKVIEAVKMHFDDLKVTDEEIEKRISKIFDDTFGKKLTIDKIGGLKEEIRVRMERLRQGGGSSGGGMGNFRPIAFNGDGVTTEFTLSDVPTSDANALMVFIQGQYQHNGVHYSVSGKILTFSTAPEDGTYIEGWLIT